MCDVPITNYRIFPLLMEEHELIIHKDAMTWACPPSTSQGVGVVEGESDFNVVVPVCLISMITPPISRSIVHVFVVRFKNSPPYSGFSLRRRSQPSPKSSKRLPSSAKGYPKLADLTVKWNFF